MLDPVVSSSGREMKPKFWLMNRQASIARRPIVAATAAALPAAHLRGHDVVVQRLEAQQAGGHRAVEGERRPVPCGGTQGVLVGDVPGRGDEAHVVDQRLGVGPEPQSERRGHGDLQMGVPGHQYVAVAFAELLQAVEECLRVVGDLAQLVAQEELEVDEYLVVARTPRVDLLAHVAQPAREHQLDLRMDVLGVGLDLETPGLDLRGDLPEPRGERSELLGGQQPDLLEHGDVCQRSFDVVACELQVEFAVLTYGVLLDHLVGFETLVPKFGAAHAYRFANCSMYCS